MSKIVKYGGGFLAATLAAALWGQGSRPSSSPPPAPDPIAAAKGALLQDCRRLVLARLPAPLTAEWPGLADEVPPRQEGAGVVWRAWVRHRNLAGVPLRLDFTCRKESLQGPTILE